MRNGTHVPEVQLAGESEHVDFAAEAREPLDKLEKPGWRETRCSGRRPSLLTELLRK
jgi:hypothetical protein